MFKRKMNMRIEILLNVKNDKYSKMTEVKTTKIRKKLKRSEIKNNNNEN